MAALHMMQGRPAEVIVRLAGELNAGILVVGTHGRPPLTQALIGSVGCDVLSATSRPALMVRGDGRGWPPTMVVVEDDGSPGSRDALDAATHFAALSGAQLVLAAVVTTGTDDASGHEAVASARDRLERDADISEAALARRVGATLVRSPGSVDGLVRLSTSCPARCMVVMRRAGRVGRGARGSDTVRRLAHSYPVCLLLGTGGRPVLHHEQRTSEMWVPMTGVAGTS